jgi:hypothetical protein
MIAVRIFLAVLIGLFGVIGGVLWWIWMFVINKTAKRKA